MTRTLVHGAGRMALDRDVFAMGALRAGQWLVGFGLNQWEFVRQV